MSTPKIDYVARCIFPEGKAVLAAYGPGEEFLVGVTVNTPSPARWALQGVTKADRKRMERVVAETYN